MDLFLKAKQVRLVTYKDKYLSAEEDGEAVCQTRDGSSKNVVWTVECEEGRNIVKLKSCYGKYLAATNIPIIPGHTGKRVVQTFPGKTTNDCIEWEPIRDGFQFRLKTLMGDFLRPHGSLSPWRNTITHDVPHMPKTREKLLWDLEVVNSDYTAMHNVPHTRCSNVIKVVNNDYEVSHRRSKSDDVFSRFCSTNMNIKPFSAINFN